MRRQLWWLLPLTVIWLVGMWMATLYFQTDAPRWAVIVILAGNVVTFAISAFVGVRRPDVRVGQLFTLATAGFAVSPFLLPDVVEFIPIAMVRPLAVGGAVFSSFALASVGLLIALFPDGHHTSRRWRWLSWYAGAFVVVFTPLSAREFAIADLDGATPFPEALSDAMFLAGMFAFLAALVSLGFRFRRGDRQTRAQVGWLFYAVSIYALFLIVSGPIGLEESIVGAALDQVFYVPLPIAIAIAVLRYRLYEIDRVVSRTVSYTVVVAAMVGVYAGVISLIHLAVPLEEDLAVAVSTLAAVALTVPLWRRVRKWVDRRFFRSRYDAATVVSRVAGDLQTTVDLAEVERRTSDLVDEVFAPEAVGIWLAADR